ncbi:response regulator [Rhodopila sp.]|jgi:DNA-binding response OmpR family regulator|uniref:response regulator n=1 Tax=Rhodopila sp. TaxID=2480087 RepID=UPI002B83D7BC|nr:hypothetical protein [Rhodopila sp.]HVZ09014.1 hypothetical protein [Rhodopila sp.]
MSTPPVIIISEPDAIFGGMLRVEFSQAGFTVLMASSALEAEIYAGQVDADLVILDTAPQGTGSFDACARLRRHPRYRTTPIVLTTRVLGPRQDRCAAIAGATVILGKPYAFGDLMRSLEARLPRDHALLAMRAPRPGMADASGVVWGKLPPLTWKCGPESGLSQNARVLPVMRGPTAR